MKAYTVTPLNGFGPLQLGRNQDWLRGALKAEGFTLSWTRRSIDAFDAGNIQLEYDDNWNLQHIGLSASNSFVALYHGKDVFDLAAPELFALINSFEASKDHVYDPVEYVFPNQIISLWEADTQYDLRGKETREVYGPFGIGNPRYLKAIQEIEFRGK